jgi:hypothetical protein
MNAFRRGSTIAATVLSGLAVTLFAYALADAFGWAGAAGLVALVLVAVWGSWLGVNAVYRAVFERGQVDERGKDTDFI